MTDQSSCTATDANSVLRICGEVGRLGALREPKVGEEGGERDGADCEEIVGGVVNSAIVGEEAVEDLVVIPQSRRELREVGL